VLSLEQARPLIDAGLVYTGGTHLYEDVVALVEAGLLQYWPAPRSVCLTEILQSPRKKVFNVWLVAGDMGELIEMYPRVEQWAKDQGCTIATFTGRPGWERSFLATQEGWTTQLVVMTKDISECPSLPAIRS
jgi:hypothetical protein